ncbi:serine/threonine protein kinase [Thermococcus stetteri]|uniref:serine/threonine protein kinase n=1 Tax=Thermococcus stetteri TaxID=49900 RepID=UPI001AE7300B|nr:serine/threonine protein kinase [Thermococcus stetteri]MBP1911370.1 putative serine/threonine protein kinase [Thermococcus stetteri]
MTFEHIISSKRLGDFLRHLAEEGVGGVEPLAKGTTSLVFTGVLGGRKVVIKLQRPDSPRSNFEKEAELTKIASTLGATPPIVGLGEFEGLPYLIREFAEGEPILFADVGKRHLFRIVEKTALLDRLGIDHGQIQGGKHLIIGEDVYLIDFEKAGFRKPNNLTSAMAMIFIGENAISKRVRERFGLDDGFREEMKDALRNYKRTGSLSRVLDLLSAL